MLFLLAQVCAGVYVVAEGGWTKGDVRGQVDWDFKTDEADEPDFIEGCEYQHKVQLIDVHKSKPGVKIGFGYRHDRLCCSMSFEIGLQYHGLSYTAQTAEIKKFMDDIDTNAIGASGDKAKVIHNAGRTICHMRRDFFSALQSDFKIQQQRLSPYASIAVYVNRFGSKIKPFFGCGVMGTPFRMQYKDIDLGQRWQTSVSLLGGMQMDFNKRWGMRIGITYPVWSSRMDFDLKQFDLKRFVPGSYYTKMQVRSFKAKNLTINWGVVLNF